MPCTAQKRNDWLWYKEKCVISKITKKIQIKSLYKKKTIKH